MLDFLADQFFRESETVSHFQHPHIVRGVEVFEELGTAYLVMRYQGVNANLNYGGWQGQLGRRSARQWGQRPLNPYLGLPAEAPDTDQAARVFQCPADRGPLSPANPLSAFQYFGKLSAERRGKAIPVPIAVSCRSTRFNCHSEPK